MDITVDDLNKFSITQLKALLVKIKKEPKNIVNDQMIVIIKNVIITKKRKGYIIHPVKGIRKPIHYFT